MLSCARVAADVPALLAGLGDAARNHLVDESGIDAGAPDELREREAEEVDGMPACERTAAPPDRVRTAPTITASRGAKTCSMSRASSPSLETPAH